MHIKSMWHDTLHGMHWLLGSVHPRWPLSKDGSGSHFCTACCRAPQ